MSFLLLGAGVPANPPGEDLSDPELVVMYLWLECEALEYSYEAMGSELNLLSLRYMKCIELQDSDLFDNPWFGLQCVFLEQNFDFRYSHAVSVRVAYNMMCTLEGRKEDRYEIDF